MLTILTFLPGDGSVSCNKLTPDTYVVSVSTDFFILSELIKVLLIYQILR